jgi:rhodanese-related sulfurtransferase
VGEFPSLQAVYKQESALSGGVAFLNINVEDTAQAAKAFMLEKGYNMPVVLGKGTDVLTKYNIVNKPTSFFIDSQGVIRSFKLGPFIDEKDLKSFFGEISVSPSETTQPGSIRFTTPAELAQMMLATAGLPYGTVPDFVLVDCRSPYAFEEIGLGGAWSLPPAVPGYPATETQVLVIFKNFPLDKPLIFYDQASDKDGDAMQLAQQLLSSNLGFQAKNVSILKGGLTLWDALGYPLSMNACTT